MATFPRMAEIVPPAVKGCAVVEHYEITKFDAMRDSIHGIATAPGKVAILRVNGQTMMSDTMHEHRTNSWAVYKAKGRVLIGGLGLGMVLHAVLAKKEVQHVTVVEKYQDVIDLIAPTLPKTKKLTVVCADIFTWRPAKGEKFDSIYFDIWPDICTDNLEEIAKLHQAFKGYKAKDGWMDSWCSEELRAQRREEKRNAWY